MKPKDKQIKHRNNRPVVYTSVVVVLAREFKSVSEYGISDSLELNNIFK
jgi:hypothetical protein